MGSVAFIHPEPPPGTSRIWPVFLPFAGCPFRCVFCAQDKQTGQDQTSLESLYRTLNTDLAEAAEAERGPYELAFYGGTFTALPEPWPRRFLELAATYRTQGLIERVRCSTRPDCVAPDLLAELRALGLDMVELGIQSFDDRVLAASGRGYHGDTARQACDVVRQSGLGLGIQLLPGLPGDREGVFQSDARQAAAFEPETARLYPCLVIRGTGLARRWEQGEYTPWALKRTTTELAHALPIFWKQGVRVIRLGLPPEGTLAKHILAGPWHPALGQSVRGLALFRMLRDRAGKAGRLSGLDVPRRYQGELMGHANELAVPYAELGLAKGRIRYVDDDAFTLYLD